MSLQFIFGGSGKGKSYFKGSEAFSGETISVRRAGAVYDADTKRTDRDQR